MVILFVPTLQSEVPETGNEALQHCNSAPKCIFRVNYFSFVLSTQAIYLIIVLNTDANELTYVTIKILPPFWILKIFSTTPLMVLQSGTGGSDF